MRWAAPRSRRSPAVRRALPKRSTVPSASSSAGATRAFTMTPGSATRVRRVFAPTAAVVRWTGPGGAARPEHASAAAASSARRGPTACRPARCLPALTATSSRLDPLIRPAAPGCARPTYGSSRRSGETRRSLRTGCSLLVDQHEARPVADPVQVPGPGVVVLRVGIPDIVLLERALDVAPVVLAGVGRELGRVDADRWSVPGRGICGRSPPATAPCWCSYSR